jgi:hypothetical protein
LERQGERSAKAAEEENSLRRQALTEETSRHTATLKANQDAKRLEALKYLSELPGVQLWGAAVARGGATPEQAMRANAPSVNALTKSILGDAMPVDATPAQATGTAAALPPETLSALEGAFARNMGNFSTWHTVLRNTVGDIPPGTVTPENQAAVSDWMRQRFPPDTVDYFMGSPRTHEWWTGEGSEAQRKKMLLKRIGR